MSLIAPRTLPIAAFLLAGAILAKPAIQEARFSLTLVTVALGVACSVGLFVLGFFVVRALPVWGASFASAGVALFALSAYFDQFSPVWVLTKGGANVRVTTEGGESQLKTSTRDYLSSEDFDADFAEFRVRRGRPGAKLTLTVYGGESPDVERTYVLPKDAGFGFVIVPQNEHTPSLRVFLQVASFADAEDKGRARNDLVPLKALDGVYVLPKKPDRVCQEIPTELTFLPGAGDEPVRTSIRLLTRPPQGRLREESNFRPML